MPTFEAPDFYDLEEPLTADERSEGLIDVGGKIVKGENLSGLFKLTTAR